MTSKNSNSAWSLTCPSPSPGPTRIALLSDLHIDADPDNITREQYPLGNVRACITEILAENPAPDAVVINGDTANLKGTIADYAIAAPEIARLTDANIPVHFTLGNHDTREAFYSVFHPYGLNSPTSLDGQHVGILEFPEADIFLLDSLLQVNMVNGEFGEPQLEWLAAELDARAPKPAILIGHHHPQITISGVRRRSTGLIDTLAFLDLAKEKQNALCYICGHLHHWGHRELGTLDILSLPSAGYVFDPERPTGWALATLAPDHISLQLQALNKSHPEHEEVYSVTRAS